MLQLPGRLGTLKACDVMTKQVILLKETDTIEQAVQQLKEQHITGAPVVDTSGIFGGCPIDC
jgi:CBS-domain-containing membrane protein